MKGEELAPQTPRPSLIRRALLPIAVGLLMLLIADLIGGHLASSGWELGGKYLAPYDRPVLQGPAEAQVQRLRLLLDGAPDERPDLVTQFDAQLGWALDPTLAGLNAAGARSGPFDTSGAGDREVLALAFGCSFTYGDEVQGDETWCVELERRRPDLRCLNFGIGGQGLDQALLRLEQEVPRQQPDEVLLALMPSAAPRAATHVRGFDSAWSRMVWLKPRVSLDANGALVRHPVPAASARDVLQILEEPDVFRERLAGDRLMAAHGAAFAPRNTHLLHRSFVGRVFLTWRVFSAYPPETSLADSPIDLEALHLAIAQRANEVCVESGATLRYLILPSAKDLGVRDSTGGAPWAGLVQELERSGVEVLDASKTVLGVPADRRWQPQGHYSPETNAAVGAWLAELTRR